MGLLALAKAVISRRRRLMAAAAVLSASALAVGLSAVPASASSDLLGTYEFTNYQTGNCLVAGFRENSVAFTAATDPLCAFPMWYAITDPYGGFVIQNAAEPEGLCLAGNSALAGSSVYLVPCNPNDISQNWTVGGQGPASTLQWGPQNGFCLNDDGNGSVTLQPCNWSNTYQNWSVDMLSWGELPSVLQPSS
jgi:hypothetical protein